MTKKTYVLHNLGCANCARKIEERVAQLPNVEQCSIVFATKKMRLSAEDHESLLPEIAKIANSIENGVVVELFEEHPHHKTGYANDEGLAGCTCGHDHCEAHDSCDGEASHTHTHSDSCKAHDSCDGEASHTHTHSDSHTHSDAGSESAKDLRRLIAGGITFALSILVVSVFELNKWAALAMFAVSYIILGYDVLIKAAKNISRGEVFDENFLMCIATIGAFAIGEFPEAVAVMLFYRLGEYFETRAVEYSRREIMKAVDMRPETVTRIRGGADERIDASTAKVGDVLRVLPGDRIPLDGEVVEGESRIDVSPITGEPVPVAAHPGVALTSGCINLSGVLKMRVARPLSESMVTRILDAVENAAANKPRVERFITKFSKVYTPVVCAAALLLAVIPPLAGLGAWSVWLYRALVFLVVSCPCALVLSVPLAFFSGIGLGSKKGILFKGGASIEALTDIKNVIMDKTGTVTKGVFDVTEVRTETGVSQEELLRYAASAEMYSTHPIARSIITAAQKRSIEPDEPQSVSEVAGKGLMAKLQSGAVLCGSAALMRENGIDVVETHGATEVFVSVDGRLKGSVLISDVEKEDAAAAVAAIKRMGLKTIMLTGDNEDSAKEVAARLGIERVYARMLPDQKLSVMQQVREESGAAMFVGDGINDAPVLAGADAGAAMGAGADAAIEAADIVFMNSNAMAIPQSIDIARSTRSIAVQNIVLALTIKIGVMVLSLFGLSNLWLAVFADVGVALLCVANSLRLLKELYFSGLNSKRRAKAHGSAGALPQTAL